MHDYTREAGEKDTMAKTRGSTNNQRRLDAFSSRGGDTVADWAACDAKRLQAVVVGITELGGAVTFGLARDRGAHMLTLLLDDTRETLWFNRDANLDDELKTVVGTIDSLE